MIFQVVHEYKGETSLQQPLIASDQSGLLPATLWAGIAAILSVGSGRVLAAQRSVRPSTAIEEQVQCTVRYDNGVLINMYHGFHQPSRMDRQELRLVFERGDVTLYEWVPTRVRIHGIADEAATRTLCDLFPGARLDVSRLYQGQERRCRCRQKSWMSGRGWN